jgi:hypothetical protein
MPFEESELPWRMQLRLPQEWGREIEELAAARAVPKTGILRLLIRRALDEEHRQAESRKAQP